MNSIFFFLFPISLQAKSQTYDKLYDMYSEINKEFGLYGKEKVLLINGETQKIHLANISNSKLFIHKTYSISTSKKGFGNQNGSKKTPLGIHRIEKKYGENYPLGTVFDIRRRTRKIAKIYREKNQYSRALVTSRLMWLAGCEPKNKDTFYREIYIHGTNLENLIGTPASGGCIRMKNKDVIELFDLVDTRTYVNLRA